MQISPLIYNEKGHRIASDDDVLDPKHIKVSADKANVLTNDEAGLAVKAEDLVSAEDGNLLSVGADGKLKAAASDASTLVSAESDNTLTTGADGKLYVPPVELTVDVLSKDDGNMLRYGSDEGLFLDGNDVLSNGDKNLLKINGIDGLIELTKETLESAGFLSGQAKIAGVQPNDPLLSLDSAGFLSTSFDVEYDETTGLTKFKGADGRVAATVTLPVAVKTIRSVTLETNPLTQGEGTFIHFVFETTGDAEQDIYLNVDKLFNVYKAGTGIDISTDGTISMVVSDMVALEPDNVIQEKDGKLYVSPISVYGELVSSDPDNIITKGTDQRVFLGKAQLDVAMNSIVQEGAMKLVSQDENNVLTEGADKGAMLSKDSLASAVQEQITGGKVKVVSSDLQNTITEGSDKGAYLSEASFGEAFTKVRKAGLLKVVSEDATNVITEGTDKGALLSKAKLGSAIKEGVTSGDVVITSGDRDNLLQSGMDGGATLTRERLVSVVGGIVAEGNLTVVSTDGGNVVKEGSDRGAYLSKSDFKTAVTEAVQSKGSGVVSSNMDNVIKEGPDGGANLTKEDFAAAMEEAIQGGTVPLVSTDGDNLIIEGGDGGAFLDTAAIGSAMEEGLTDGSIDLISTDAKNAATLGSDHKVFVEDKWLPLSGGTLTGSLVLSGNPSDGSEAATKAYVDNAVKKSGGRGLSVGHMLLWPYKTAPTGFVLADGLEIRRDVYSALWSFLEKNPELVKEELEWQEMAKQNNGYCSFYSKGDGTVTFRVPKFAPYMQLANNAVDATTYHAAGLPNIEGSITVPDESNNFKLFVGESYKTTAKTPCLDAAGALGFIDHTDYVHKLAGQVDSGASAAGIASLTFDASKSNGLYGASETVQPESMEWNVIIAALDDTVSADDTDLKALQDTLKRYTQTVDSVLPLGYFFDWPFKTPPTGALHANGDTVRRDVYGALWQQVQKHSDWLKTESEWQEIAKQNNGYCSYYSDGDGSQTFRLPKFAPFRHTVNSLAEAGRYNPDNIGDIDLALRVADDAKQVATKAYQDGARLDDPYGLGATGGWMNGGVSNGTDEGFYKQSLATSDADKAGDLLFPYAHSGEHIIPESSNWIACIVAYAPVSEEKEIKYEELKQTIQEFTQSVGSIVPLGQFFSWPYKEAPAGALVCNGGEYNRALYKDLWAMVQAHPSWMKTESEWQEIASANNGYCPYYSDGSDEGKFRLPKFAPHIEYVSDLNQVSLYREAGLPNIEGAASPTTKGGFFKNIPTSWPPYFEGAFTLVDYPDGSVAGVDSTAKYTMCTDVVNGAGNDLGFDASKSNAIYGKSSTVQPESHTWLICVVAYNTAVPTGSVSLDELKEAVEEAKITVAPSFPSGTRMLFHQEAAPVGWVKDANIDDTALRVISGDTGGSSFGSTPFSELFDAGKAITLSGTVGETTLSTAQMPGHSHSGSVYISSPKGQAQAGHADYNTNSAWGGMGSAGGGQSHTHTLEGGTASVTLGVKYTDVIICTKE